MQKCTVGAGRNLPPTVYDEARPPHHWPPDNKPTKMNFYVGFNASPPTKQKHSNKLKLLFESNLNQFSLNRNKLRAQYILGWIHGPPGGVHFERKIHPVEECWKICLILNTMWNFRHWIWRPLSFSRTTLDLLKQNTCKYLLWPAKTPALRFYFKLSADPGRRLDRCRLWCRGPKT